MKDVQKKREQEQALLRWMVEKYCRGQHGSPKGQLCPQCYALASYAQNRTQRCPRMAEKTFCAGCPHPCYSAEHREGIRKVMRYSGPRMLLHSPGMALRHVSLTVRQKIQQRRRANEHTV